MKPNPIKASRSEAPGSVQAAVGRSLGCEEQEAAGVLEQLQDELQSKIDKMKEVAIDAIRKL